MIKAYFGLPVAVHRGVTFLSVMVNGIQSTNALQNGRSMGFSKNIRIKIEDIGCTHCIPSQSNDKVHLHQESVWEQE